jgi:hypothetical protein
MDNKTRRFLTLFMGDFHMSWDTTANTAVNVKKPQTSDVIGFAVHKENPNAYRCVISGPRQNRYQHESRELIL